jgi:D-alanine transaminase
VAGQRYKYRNGVDGEQAAAAAGRSTFVLGLPEAVAWDYSVVLSDRRGDLGFDLSEGMRAMRELACLNGEAMPVEQAKVPIWDRGFLFGDSVYEVFRMYRGRCWLEAEHYARLKRSLAELEFPPVDLARLKERIDRTITQSEILEGMVYVQITRGVAARTHAFPDPSVPPTELIVVRPYDDGPTGRARGTGVAVITYPDLRWGRCDIKTTNLLANCMATTKAKQAGCFEAILVDPEGLVTEATHTSLVWVRNGRVEGTPEGPEILPGMTRHFVLKLLAEIGIPFAEARVSLEELKAADEAILVGTTSEVVSIVTVDGEPVGSGKPGPVAGRLWEAYRRAVDGWLAGVG